MSGAVYRVEGDFFVSLSDRGEEIDVAGPFGDASEAMDMARRWTPCVSVDCNLGDHAFDAHYSTLSVHDTIGEIL